MRVSTCRRKATAVTWVGRGAYLCVVCSCSGETLGSRRGGGPRCERSTALRCRYGGWNGKRMPVDGAADEVMVGTTVPCCVTLQQPTSCASGSTPNTSGNLRPWLCAACRADRRRRRADFTPSPLTHDDRRDPCQTRCLSPKIPIQKLRTPQSHSKLAVWVYAQRCPKFIATFLHVGKNPSQRTRGREGA